MSRAEPDCERTRSLRPLGDFLHDEAVAAMFLVAAAALAMVWANSAWSDAYHDLWSTELALRIGDHALELDLQGWINDAAMVLFFLVVGLEIKRELTEGELRDPRQAALPIVAAFGGMVVPALLYVAVVGTGEGSDGWAIPMATDIAIVVGVVALLASRVPPWLKLFLLALAIVDDIGAIVVIAVFYSDGVSLAWLAAAVATLIVAAVVRRWVPYGLVCIVLVPLCWLALHEAHVHPTLAGVAFGLLAPNVPRHASGFVDADQLERQAGGESSSAAADDDSSVSVVEWLEHLLHPWSAFLVVPLFALANAGVTIPVDQVDDAATSRVAWGVVVGLVIGKPVGISVATWLAVRLRLGRLPPGVTVRHMIGAGALGGIGFTVSLFVTDLAFGESTLGTDARLGVIGASLVAAAIGAAISLSAGRIPAVINHVFVYGTLRPGDVRWPILAPFAADEGTADTTGGRVYDTGLGYPAAVFDDDGTVVGRTYRLRSHLLDEALAALDAEESSVPGGYRRIELTTGSGVRAWAYEYGDGLDLTPIDGGDWLSR